MKPKIIKLLLAIFAMLLITHSSAEYLNSSPLAKPFALIILSSFWMLVIVFYVETKNFGYIIVILATYPVLAPVFAMEVLMFNDNPKQNLQWFKERYSYKMFKIEFYIFLPVIVLFYLLFFSHNKKSASFSMKNILNEMKEVL